MITRKQYPNHHVFETSICGTTLALIERKSGV